MTLEKAIEIKNLLNARDGLISQIREFQNCDSIDGHINDGVNGLGFRWDKNSIQVKWLIKGLKEELTRIDEAISRIQIKDDESEGDKMKKI